MDFVSQLRKKDGSKISRLTAKEIQRLILSEAKSSVPLPPTGSFINELSVTMPNLLYNLINLVLIEDQSDRPISDLEVEMSGGNQYACCIICTGPNLRCHTL